MRKSIDADTTYTSIALAAAGAGLRSGLEAAVIVLAYVGAVGLMPQLQILPVPGVTAIAVIAGGFAVFHAIGQAIEDSTRLAAWHRHRSSANSEKP